MEETVRQHLLDRVKKNAYVNHLEIDFVEIEDGRVVARMPLKPEQRQYSGVVHGGVLAAFADTVAGFAAYTMTSIDRDVLTVNLQFAECEIYCDGKLVSKASGTFCVVHPQI